MTVKAQVMNQSFAGVDPYEQIKKALERPEFKSVGHLFSKAAKKYLGHLEHNARIRRVKIALHRFYSEPNERRRIVPAFLIRFLDYLFKPPKKLSLKKKRFKRPGVQQSCCKSF